jgi:hypothetical protein
MRRNLLLLLAGAGVAALIFVAGAYAYSKVEKRSLPRDNVYYEITNDAGDYGNYIELYHIPVPGPNGDRKPPLFCVVYSDQIGKSGGGAGEVCNFDAFNHGVAGDKPGWLKNAKK